MRDKHKGTDMEDNVYVLASLAGVAPPDLQESPGGVWLRQVASYAVELNDDHSGYGDAIHEAADAVVPVYTHELWSVFVDLAAYNEDISEYAPTIDGDELSKVPSIALYRVAERLLEALRYKDEDKDDDDDA